MIKITKRSEFPKCVRKFKELKGIYIGGCIDGEILERHGGHAHCGHREKYQGWICLRYKYFLKEKLTMLHEVAHLIANTSYKTPPHGKKWKETVKNIGGTFKEYEYKHNGHIYFVPDYTYRNNML